MHTTKDNEDILFCYLWAKRKSCVSHGGYMNYMVEKWNECRPDKSLTKTALATKGKRLFDRALKDFGGKGWLGLADLRRVEGRVNLEFSTQFENEPEGEGEACGDEECSSSCDGVGGPKSEKPECEEYMRLLERARELNADLKSLPVEKQMRRVIKKKSFSATKCAWMDWMAHELILDLSIEERLNLSCINTMYAVAAVITFVEGQELACDGAGGGSGKKKEVVPKWKVRLERRVENLRKEADILRAFLDRRIKSVKANAFVSSVMKKYGIDGSKAATEATLFSIRNQISAIACKIRRFVVQTKAKQQNKLFANDKKKFYRSIFEDGNNVVNPPSEEGIRTFWEQKIWGDSNKYTGDAAWLDEIRKSCKGIEEQVWLGITERDVTDQLGRSMNWKAAGHDSLSNYWIKNMPSAHSSLAKALNCCVERPEQLPAWLVKGRTTLLAKSQLTLLNTDQ